MRHSRAFSCARLIAMVSCGFVLLAVVAAAQSFQAADGGGMVESGRGGVQPLAAGTGYISVGHTTSFGGTADVYVVQTNNAGGIAWAFAYNIGGNDYGHDIQQCVNGDFVITGTTNVAGNPDLFIMRINPGGGVLWTRTAGGAFEDQWMDVHEALNGDIVAAGWSFVTAVNRDGYLVRVTGAGAAVFTRTYTGGANLNDWFHGLWVGGNGDLLVCGGTTSFGNANQGWVLRTTPGGLPIWSNHYGGANSNEEFNSLVVLTVGAQAGNIVCVGSTNAVGMAGTLDFVVVKYAAAGGFIAPDITGGTDAGTEEMFQIRENTVVAPVGNLQLAGRMNPGPLGGEDGYVVQMVPLWNCPVGKVWSMVYGGQRDDRLYSSEEVPNNCIPGFIHCGWTASPGLVPAGDPQQHYLIKTDGGGNSGCNEMHPDDRCTEPNLPSVAVAINTLLRAAPVTRLVGGINAPPGAVLCFTACPGPKRNLPEEEALFGLASFYPNPVVAGSSFRIDYTLGKGNDVTVVVSDITGRIIDRRTATSSGSGSMTINTDGWPSGTYLVQVDLGTETQTKRIVVMEK